MIPVEAVYLRLIFWVGNQTRGASNFVRNLKRGIYEFITENKISEPNIRREHLPDAADPLSPVYVL